MNKHIDHITQGKKRGEQRELPVHGSVLIEDGPVDDKENREHYVAQDAFHLVVQRGITGRIVGEERVEDNQGDDEPQHDHEMQMGCGRHITVFLFPGCLDQLKDHHAGRDIAGKIGKVDIEVAGKLHIEKTDAAHTGDQGEGAEHGLKDQLSGSASGELVHVRVPF